MKCQCACYCFVVGFGFFFPRFKFSYKVKLYLREKKIGVASYCHLNCKSNVIDFSGSYNMLFCLDFHYVSMGMSELPNLR